MFVSYVITSIICKYQLYCIFNITKKKKPIQNKQRVMGSIFLKYVLIYVHAFYVTQEFKFLTKKCIYLI